MDRFLFGADALHCAALDDRSQYQDLPLLPAEDFAELYNQSTPPPGLVLPLPEDPHELMLARLTFELAERTRCASTATSLFSI